MVLKYGCINPSVLILDDADFVMQVHGTHDLCDCGYVLLSLKQKENALQFVSFEFISYL